MISKFNIRVYGLWVRGGSILVSEEQSSDYSFTKFPGGGLEFGEGIKDCMIRELREELGVHIADSELDHYYTTDFFQSSFFNPQEQIISVYYRIHSNEVPDLEGRPNVSSLPNHRVRARWVALSELKKELMTFPIDQYIVESILAREM